MENGNSRQQKSSDSKETALTHYERLMRYIKEQNKKPDVVIAEVEEFLKAYKAGEQIITAESRTMTVTTTTFKKGWFGGLKKVKETTNFCDALGDAIASYQASKELDYYLKWEHAYTLLSFIQRARTFGVILNAKQQQQDYEQEIQRLKEQIDNLKKLNDKLIAENKILHGIANGKANYKTKGKGDTEIGDVDF
jgi:hypothetical protein